MKTLKDVKGTYLWEYAEWPEEDPEKGEWGFERNKAEADGEDKALVILTGLGGSADGFGNKYVRIAEYVQNDYGASVFISPTPKDVWDRKEGFFDEVAAHFMQNKTCVYLMGVSAGATMALWYAAKYPQIKRILCVNPVLNINLHLTSNGIRNFVGERMTIVFGEKDPSAKWTKILPAAPHLQIHIVPNADHLFSGKLEEFIDLPKKYLFT